MTGSGEQAQYRVRVGRGDTQPQDGKVRIDCRACPGRSGRLRSGDRRWLTDEEAWDLWQTHASSPSHLFNVRLRQDAERVARLLE